jgi:hypothetical protein
MEIRRLICGPLALDQLQGVEASECSTASPSGQATKCDRLSHNAAALAHSTTKSLWCETCHRQDADKKLMAEG